MSLSGIKIILVAPSHPGNIGATARAMKTMGLSQLVLVRPKSFPDPQAEAMASGAVDILAQATVVDTLEDAIADCGLLFGTSSRTRYLDWPLVDARTAATTAAEHHQEQIGILFGQERMGLTNEELSVCHYHVYIPGNPDYCSLNLSQAVQIICYELRQAFIDVDLSGETRGKLASRQELTDLYDHLATVMREIDYLKSDNPRKTLARFQRLLQRAQLERLEVNMLRGFLKAVGRAKLTDEK